MPRNGQVVFTIKYRLKPFFSGATAQNASDYVCVVNHRKRSSSVQE